MDAVSPLRRRLVAIAIAMALVGCTSGSGGAISPPATTAAGPSADTSGTLTGGITVDVGGRSLFIYCVGTGSPTVILEAGMTGNHRTWEDVAPVIKGTRVCAYDRANIPPSDPAPKPRTATLAVADLKALLTAAGIQPPYVLVGFSIGGLLSQVYAASYPQEIAGLVLVDANDPNQATEFDAHLTAAQVAADRAETLDNSEGFDPFTSFDQARAAGPLPNVPLVVVSAGLSVGWPDGWDPAVFDALHAKLQLELVGLIPGGRQVIATQSDHDIPHEQPDLVVQAIESVLAASH